MARTTTPRRRKDPYAIVKPLALALPGVEEGTSYGTPAFRVRKKLFARLHPDGESLVLRVDPADRDVLLEDDPDVFHLTDHYLHYPWVLVRVARAKRQELAELLEDAWRLVAPPRLVKARDAES